MAGQVLHADGGRRFVRLPLCNVSGIRFGTSWYGSTQPQAAERLTPLNPAPGLRPTALSTSSAHVRCKAIRLHRPSKWVTLQPHLGRGERVALPMIGPAPRLMAALGANGRAIRDIVTCHTATSEASAWLKLFTTSAKRESGTTFKKPGDADPMADMAKPEQWRIFRRVIRVATSRGISSQSSLEMYAGPSTAYALCTSSREQQIAGAHSCTFDRGHQFWCPPWNWRRRYGYADQASCCCRSSASYVPSPV
jgi:hypothetical protein